jgi:predicted N-formylglutamate amidohydrolase
MDTVLSDDEAPPVIAERLGARSPFLFVCDHAGRETPRRLDRLGLEDWAFERHIAWDIGAAAVTRALSAALGAACLMQRYSRLVIDCNRAPDRLDAAPAVSDGVIIPANESLSPEALADRVREIHAPYHHAIAAELDARAAMGLQTVVVFVHSFTPIWAGLPRPWHFGVLRGESSRFSATVLAHLSRLEGFVIGDNEPYALDEKDYSAPLHAMARGHDYLELEIRQDLIGESEGQARIAGILTGLFPAALADTA